MNYRISMALLLWTAAGSALAHGELPTITACSSHKPVYLGTFNYREKGLREYKVCLKRESGNPWLRDGGNGGGGGGGHPPVCQVQTVPITMVACPAQTCGEFDDDYRTARALALAACNAYVGAGTDYPEGGLVIPVFNGPATFLDEDHHQLYDLADGISGVCALCPDEAL